MTNRTDRTDKTRKKRVYAGRNTANCGVLPENGGFRGIGLNGKVLEPAPIVKELHPTLMEMIRRQRLIF